jgi:ABC-type transporter Mla subunit MlaD
MITSSSLLSEVFLDFTSGVEASGVAPDGSTFLGEKALGLSDAVPMVLAKLDPALKKATETFDSLERTADNLSKLTAPDGEVTGMLKEFRNVGGNLDHLSAADGPLHKSLDNIALLTGEGGKLSKILEHMDEITAKAGPLQQVLHNAEKLTSDLANSQDLRFTLRNSRAATGDLDRTLLDLRGKFTGIADNLEQATDTLKRQPWRLIWPSTKTYPAAFTPAVRSSSKLNRNRN